MVHVIKGTAIPSRVVCELLSLYNKVSGFGVFRVYRCSDTEWAARTAPVAEVLPTNDHILTTQCVTLYRQAGSHFRYEGQAAITSLCN